MCKYCLRVFLLVSAIVLDTGHLQAVEGDLALLDQVIQSYRSNRQGVHSWQGRIEVLDVRSRADSAPVQGISVVTFAFQEQPYALTWRWEPNSPDVLKSERLRGLIVDGKYYSLLTSARPDGKEARTARIQFPDKMDRGPQTQTFDPLYYLGY
jgi:hypothetical protein